MSHRVLIVESDPAVLRMYQDALTRHGFEVDAENDGVAAVQRLRETPPNLVVLDLMMPHFTGVDVLKYMRGEGGQKHIPVVLLSNSFINDMAGQAVAIGVQRALFKMRCSPHHLIAVIRDVLAGKPGMMDPTELLALPKPIGPTAQAAGLLAAEDARDAGQKRASAEFHADARKYLHANATKIRLELHQHSQAVAHARNDAEREMLLNNFCRRVRFLAVAAGMAECHDISLLASVFEALVFELISRPDKITPSVRRTLVFTTDFLARRLEIAQRPQSMPIADPQALVVDDDPLSNRLVTAALRRAHLAVRSAEDPLAALQWARESHFDLVVLDIAMPGMDGFEFCKQLRALREYERTPVIFVTSHNDFEHRAQSVLSGGNDLIGKPILPIELAVKALMHMLNASEAPATKR